MKYTLGTAAKATGKSRTTILRAIENGRISAPKNDIGHYQIDPAELHRVFPAKEQGNSPRNSKMERDATEVTVSENKALEIEIKLLREQLNREKEISEDLQGDRDMWRQQATNLLTDQREKETPSTQNSGLLGGLKNILWGNGNK